MRRLLVAGGCREAYWLAEALIAICNEPKTTNEAATNSLASEAQNWGTAQAAHALMQLHDARPFHEIVYMLAGITESPRVPQGAHSLIRKDNISVLNPETWAELGIVAVIDATHPFATTIQAKLRAFAQHEFAVPHITIRRPPWQQLEADQWMPWHEDAELHAILAQQSQSQTTVFALGGKTMQKWHQQGWGKDLPMKTIWRTLARAHNMPMPAHPRASLITFRPNDGISLERARLQALQAKLVVMRNSGGQPSGLLQAARSLNIPIYMQAYPA